MRRAGLLVAVFLVLGSILLARVGVGRADEAEDRSWLIGWVERTISTPDRKISLGRIDGVLSSDVRIASITVADRRGVWLTVSDVHLIWSRAQLLRRILSIDLLEAGAIEMTRSPDPAPGVQPAAGPGFALPDLPVAVRLGRLAVPKVALPASVAGQDTVLTARAAGRWDGDAVDIDVAAERTRPAGGSFALKAAWDAGSRRLGLHLNFSEPAGGLVSTLLALPGAPGIDFAVDGDGPIDDFKATIALAAGGDRLLSGTTTIGRGPEGQTYAADVSGDLTRLTAPDRADLLRGGTKVSVAAHRTAAGGLVLDHATVRTGILSLDASAALAPDWFPTSLRLDGRLARGDGAPTPLPATGATVTAATLRASFADGDWRAAFTADRPMLPGFTAGRLTLGFTGRATNLADPAARSLTFAGDGRLEAPAPDDPNLAHLVGERVSFDAAGSWASGRAMVIDEARVSAPAGRIGFAGTATAAALTGAWTVSVVDAAPWSGLVGRALGGRAELTATGTLSPPTGAFGLAIDGTLVDIGRDGGLVAALTEGTTKLSGRVVRDTEGLHLDAVRLANDRMTASLDGLVGVWSSSLTADVTLADAGVLAPRAAGPLRLSAKLDGPHPGETLTVEATAPALTLQSERLTDAVARLTGKLGDARFDGDATLSGGYAGGRLDGAAHLALGDGEASVTGLRLAVAGASATGDLTRSAEGRIRGALAIEVPDLRRVAPLLLVTGRGAATLSARFDDADGRQDATIDAKLRDVAVEGVSLAAADVAVTGRDLLAAPQLDGTASLSRLAAGGVTVETAKAVFRRAGEATAYGLDGRAEGRAFALAGRIVPADGGVDLAIDRLSAAPAGIAVALAAPVTLAKRADGVTIPPTRLTIGPDGRLTVAGRIPTSGDGLAVSVDGTVPMALADPFLRERGTRLGGRVGVALRAAGAVTAPRLSGTATLAGGTLVDPETGVRLSAMTGALRFDGDRATIERFGASTEGGGSLRVRGGFGIAADPVVDLSVGLSGARLAAGELVRAVVGGQMTLRGPIASRPTITGRLTVDRAEITIPERFADNLATLRVKNVAPPPEVRRTLNRVRSAARHTKARAGGGFVATLDLTVDAPARLYVRGRGIDAELGGSVRLTGTTGAIVPIGAFRLRRGGLDVVGRHIDLDGGTVTLTGDLDPTIDLEASASAQAVSVKARVTGRASDPQLLLTSTPELPQDEVLAHFLFGHGLSDLSGLQLAQLGLAAAQLAGGSSAPSLLDGLRRSIGVENLSIATDSGGNPALRAGRYVGERIYLGVTTGAGGQTGATLNVDVTRQLRLRAEAGTEGAKAGAYWEKEY